MKTWIKTRLKESLDEISTKMKPIFGKGENHNVYSSKKNPNILYKIGTKKKVDEWVEIFKKYPEYFPKVYKSFLSNKDPNIKIVEIEKLDTSKASLEYKQLDNFLIDISSEVDCLNVDPMFGLSIFNFWYDGCFEKVQEAAYEMYDSDMILSILPKWADFLSSVIPIVEKELGRLVDLNYGNVAYDKNNKLKLIDI